MKITVTSSNLENIAMGELQAKWSANGARIIRYYIDFRHRALNLHKEVSAPEIYILQNKVDALIASWDQKHAEFRRKSAVTSAKDTAEQMSIAAGARLAAIGSILADTLEVDDRVDWNSLKSFAQFGKKEWFPEPQPKRRRVPEPAAVEPAIGFWDRLFGRKARKLADAAEADAARRAEWKAADDAAEGEHSGLMEGWRKRMIEHDDDYARRKAEFEERQAAANAQVDALAEAVGLGEPQAVIEHATMVLEASDYKGLFEKSFNLEYDEAGKTLMVAYDLPSMDQMPTVKSVRFVAGTGEVKETSVTEKEQKQNFDAACYQICLRTIHELFEADEHGNVERVLFNGTVTYVDRATGQDVTACIMSVLVGRAEFQRIDLSRVEPKACFKSLKGVSASTLSALAPIPPVIEMRKDDRRFIEARDVAGHVDDSTNLAAMPWEDFEHLVRQVFEKEFASRGGEVKVTQSSSDGGVDAVAFDPDPITGGKIVIQAKRYTRTVGVSAVRDLYGTMQHEGASRGILVTTADYGPDAHRFASGKPLTLLTGANLLHLLGKHGMKARIDVKGARAAWT